MIVVLLAGLYLALDRWSLGDPWISATFAILFVLFGLMGGVLTPADRRLVQADLFGSLALALVVVAILLMVAKPGA